MDLCPRAGVGVEQFVRGKYFHWSPKMHKNKFLLLKEPPLDVETPSLNCCVIGEFELGDETSFINETSWTEIGPEEDFGERSAGNAGTEESGHEKRGRFALRQVSSSCIADVNNRRRFEAKVLFQCSKCQSSQK
jgi:hypothetical protein